MIFSISCVSRGIEKVFLVAQSIHTSTVWEIADSEIFYVSQRNFTRYYSVHKNKINILRSFSLFRGERKNDFRWSISHRKISHFLFEQQEILNLWVYTILSLSYSLSLDMIECMTSCQQLLLFKPFVKSNFNVISLWVFMTFLCQLQSSDCLWEILILRYTSRFDWHPQNVSYFLLKWKASGNLVCFFQEKSTLC